MVCAGRSKRLLAMTRMAKSGLGLTVLHIGLITQSQNQEHTS